MIKVIFRCDENMNQHQEVVEFEDDATEEVIQEAFVDWVWSEVGDNYTWYREDESDEYE